PAPTVALIIVPDPSPISANFVTPLGVSNALRPPAQTIVRYPPITAWRAFPVATADAVGIEPGVVVFAISAPRKMAGQTRTPLKRTAANARPVAGQSGGLLGWLEARTPSFVKR